jgi:hypothetical protein
MYIYQYYVDRWIKKVDVMLTAKTVDSSGTGVTDIMTIDSGDSTYPILAAGDLWRVRIDVSATIDPSQTQISSVTNSHGYWTIDAIIAKESGKTSEVDAINGVHVYDLPINIPAVGTPGAFFDTPTLDLNTSTGAIEITVGHTSVTASEVLWQARIEGEFFRSIAGFIPA